MCVTAAHSWHMTADTVIGQTMPVAPPSPPPTGWRGGAKLPWQWSPASVSGDGAEKQKQKTGGKQKTVQRFSQKKPKTSLLK